LIFILIFWNCGTGPWYIQREIYETYKEPIYQNPNFEIRTDGFYSKTNDSLKINYSENIIIFDSKGYCSSISYNQMEEHIKSRLPITEDLDWWKIKNDSIIIENYGETKRLIKTSVWWNKGKILNDSIFEIAYQDKNYKYKSLKYIFVQSNEIPDLKNKARYLETDWYESKLNINRK
jgi:hypothetical protein